MAGRWAAILLGVLAAAAVTSSSASPSVTAPLPPAEAALRAHVAYLASDELKGRRADTPEFRLAAGYVADRFRDAGLQPAGEGGGYLQPVPLVTYRLADRGDFVLTRNGGAPQPLAFGSDYLPGADPGRRELAVEAPVVFVGWGVVDPTTGRDDYAGVDVRGRIVAYFPYAPRDLPSDVRAHFLDQHTRAVIAERKGAVGVVLLAANSLSPGIPLYARPRTTWGHGDGTGQRDGAPLLGVLGPGAAGRMFAHARTSWVAALRLASTGQGAFRAEPLPYRLAVALRMRIERSDSVNVAGVLPGRDPTLARETVVLSAHLDHLGIGEPVAGDAIYNGAEDNAVGVASLIEVARRFTAPGIERPRRSILFLADTAEEEGLVGADYFARHPPRAAGRIVADVNLDMPLLSYPFRDVTVYGADRSSLGAIVRQALAPLGVALSPDPDPAQGFFVRSDHYRFVQRGIPAVFLWPGPANGGHLALADFLAHRYHRPSDDLAQPIVWAEGVRFVDANYRIARAIADAAERPRWNRGDFFGLRYDGFGAR